MHCLIGLFLDQLGLELLQHGRRALALLHDVPRDAIGATAELLAAVVALHLRVLINLLVRDGHGRPNRTGPHRLRLGSRTLLALDVRRERLIEASGVRLRASSHSWLAVHGWDALASAGVSARRRKWVMWIRFG